MIDRDFTIKFSINGKDIQTKDVHFVRITDDELELRFTLNKHDQAKFILKKKDYIEEIENDEKDAEK